MARKALALPDHLHSLLRQHEERNGLPPGTMSSVMQQEVGGKFNDYLSDPGKYHYAADASGRRVAGHTGKISTAFGPFGILESTGRDPGYGVAPLRDKSIEEQIRFSADYLKARSKQAGSLEGGLAGYGEGATYGRQVAGRIGGNPPSTQVARATAPVSTASPVQVAQAPQAPVIENPPIQIGAPVNSLVQPAAAQVAAAPSMAPGPNAWEAFRQAQGPQQPTPQQLAAIGQQRAQAMDAAAMANNVSVPDFMANIQQRQAQQAPMMQAMQGFGRPGQGRFG